MDKMGMNQPNTNGEKIDQWSYMNGIDYVTSGL